MKRRKGDSKTNATIVFEGLKGKPVAAICQDYQISLAQYYRWRDQFLTHAARPLRWSSRADARHAFR